MQNVSLLQGKFSKNFVLFLDGIKLTILVGPSIKIHKIFFFDVPPCGGGGYVFRIQLGAFFASPPPENYWGLDPSAYYAWFFKSCCTGSFKKILENDEKSSKMYLNILEFHFIIGWPPCTTFFLTTIFDLIFESFASQQISFRDGFPNHIFYASKQSQLNGIDDRTS